MGKKILYLLILLIAFSGCSKKKRDYYKDLYGGWTLVSKLDEGSGQYVAMEENIRIYFYPSGKFAYHSPNGYGGMAESITGPFSVPEENYIILEMPGLNINPTITVVRDEAAGNVYFTFHRFIDGTYIVSHNPSSN